MVLKQIDTKSMRDTLRNLFKSKGFSSRKISVTYDDYIFVVRKTREVSKVQIWEWIENETDLNIHEISVD